ncbi:hypothetical protein AFCDBAGC_3492 [Methylobacterium cerastii]|uniref:Uncharacterized protein n=1 Tax=Methylobacterium cerastii TaxID=932741 RepID=A0ABQ4QK49_9HYPH|nr:hypothetical protein AFCDBAGC_3492 [Methylobacterium cerastii]
MVEGGAEAVHPHSFSCLVEIMQVTRVILASAPRQVVAVAPAMGLEAAAEVAQVDRLLFLVPEAHSLNRLGRYSS